MIILNSHLALHGFVRAGTERQTVKHTTDKQRQRHAARNAAGEGHRRERESGRARERERSSIHIAEGRGGHKAKTVTPSWPTSPCTASSAAADATRTAAANAAALAPAHCCYTSITCSWVFLMYICMMENTSKM